VRDLKPLEGEWRISALTVDGNAVPASVAASTRILIDGDRFRTESPEATYEGEFMPDEDRRIVCTQRRGLSESRRQAASIGRCRRMSCF
jgi:uncharacterized protein (TIGR03067 family)